MFGISIYGNRAIALARSDKKRLRETFWNIYAIQFACSTVACALYAICLPLIPADRRLVAFAQGVWILACLFDANWFFWGTEQFQFIVRRNIILKLIAVAAIVLLIRRPEDLTLYAFIMSGHTLANNMIIWPFLLKSIGMERPRLCKMRRHIVPILTLFIPVLAVNLYHLMDKTMLGCFSVESEAGFYYNADKLVNIPKGIVKSLNTVMLPHMAFIVNSAEQTGVKRVLKKSTEVTVFLLSAVVIGIGAVANEFVPFFFGSGYEPCVRLVYWFMPTIFAKVISSLVCSQYMIPAHMDKQYALSVWFGTASNLIANFLLIRRYGALGAVWGTLIAEVVVMLCDIFYTMRDIPFPRYIAENVPYVTIGMVMFLSVRKAASLIALSALPKLLCMIALGGLVYLSLCSVYWRLNRNSFFHNLNLRAFFKGGSA